MTNRGSAEGSPLGSNPMDHDPDHDEDMDSDSEAEEYRVKTEISDRDRFMSDAEGTPLESTPPKAATKQSIMSIIDRPETDREREVLASLPEQESAVPCKRKFEFETPADKENAEPDARERE
jgi:hypothetical protein